MILVWQMPPPPIELRWQGLDDDTRVVMAAAPLTPLAAIVGPPGRNAEVELPPVLDGGNF